MNEPRGARFGFDHDGPPDLTGDELTDGSYRVRVESSTRRTSRSPCEAFSSTHPGEAEHIAQPVDAS